MKSRAQIIATIGPSCSTSETFFGMVEAGADVVRLNFSWGNHEEKRRQINLVKAAEKKFGKHIPIIVDLPGPREQHGKGHGYNAQNPNLTEHDLEHIRFGIKEKVDYFALSFVGSAADVLQAKKDIAWLGGDQKVIAKIERKAAVDHIDTIVKSADAVMVARGDLGNEVPIENIPFIQDEVIRKAKVLKKPVIVATQMMFSMTKNRMPTRAEVTDVSLAILEGADAVMLSDETASGQHPVESVIMMERIASEAEKHMKKKALVRLA